MLPTHAWRAAGILLLTAAAMRPVCGADGPDSRSPNAIEIEDCTVRFVNKSTYATARAGIIAALPFDEGDYVQPGALVVRLRDEVAAANLDLRAAKAKMETPIGVANKEREAAQLAFDAATVAVNASARAFVQTEIDRLRIVSEARELQVQQAKDEHELDILAQKQAQAELESYRVHAEFGGLVTRVNKHVGEAVNLGDAIITIVDSSRVRVEGKLPYAQSRRLRVGDPVQIQLRLPDDRGEKRTSNRLGEERPPRELLAEEREVFTGRIGFIDLEVPNLGRINHVRVWAEVENRDNILLEGLPAVMRVQLHR